MTYLHWLVGTSIAFVLLERLCAWRRNQRALRPGLARDVALLALNGHFFSVWTAAAAGVSAATAVSVLKAAGVVLDGSPVPTWPLPAQFVALLVLSDLLQWVVHNLLHRVPWLWTLHKVHHSITTMDWIGNWRFHWLEPVVYRSLLWLPLASLRASPEAAFAVAVVTTVWGDFNHANLDVGWGRLGWLLNSPRMHLWHHDRSDEGGAAKNFGIVFSVWDFLFGTAYWPRERSPQRLGYPGMEEMPATLGGQLLWPLVLPWRREREASR
jgi:sterol desaturase/sphingolipid hydroxylase (fatty acid hydroxylase superfamily)